MKLSPCAKDYSPAFVALVEEFPNDPVAIDALLWVAATASARSIGPRPPGAGPSPGPGDPRPGPRR